MNPARAKVEAEGRCRVCGTNASKCDAAHLWPRSMGGGGFDTPDLVIPLCSRIKGGTGCHDEFDAHRLDVLEHLTLDEQLATVRAAGSIERARQRLAPSDYTPTARASRTIADLNAIRGTAVDPFDDPPPIGRTRRRASDPHADKWSVG
jgi:hypothetical protein